jgi:hypothetical protein
MTWYPQINSCDFSDMFTVTQCANSLTNNILFLVLIWTIFAISLIGFVFSSKSFFRGLTYSGFLCSALSILLVVMGLLNSAYMYVFIILTGLGVLGTWLSESMS